jgi:hypothetical protein
MNRIDNDLPQVPPPAYHQDPFEDPANEVAQDAHPIDQFEVINHNVQQAAHNNQLRTRGMSEVAMATGYSVASTGLAVFGANLLGQGDLIGLLSAGASVLLEGLAVHRIRKNPATTSNVALRQGIMSVGATMFGTSAGLIIGLNINANGNASGLPGLAWAAFGVDLGVAVAWEAVGCLIGRRGVKENTAARINDNALVLG